MSGDLGKSLITFLRAENNRFKNKNGMEIGITAGDELWTYFRLANYNHGPLAMNISTDGDDIHDFIKLFRITSLDDIHQLGYNHALIRYLKGYAEIGAIPFELEATITFRISGRKTLIYSLELHYYDEAYEHLTLPEDFENYVDTHENRLAFAGENRYKMNKK
ncbi:hypothetical protein GCM10027051_36000 [Niabella terrae]